jgi:hypothetical protein
VPNIRKVDALDAVNTQFLILYYIYIPKLRPKHQSNTLLLRVLQQLNGEIQSLKMDGRSATSQANTPSATASTLFKLTIRKKMKTAHSLIINKSSCILAKAPASPVSIGSLQLMQRSTNGSTYKNVIR